MASAEDSSDKKRPRLITREIAAMADSVRASFEELKRGEAVMDKHSVVFNTAHATGLSTSTIKKIQRQGFMSFPPASESESRVRATTVPREWRAAIRTTISARFLASQRVTLDALLASLTAHPPPPYCEPFAWSRTTLWRTLQRMGYVCGKGSSEFKILREQPSVAGQRLKYLRKIQELRAAGHRIFYQDETWLNKNMVPERQWRDAEGAGGRPAPSGKGSRFIVSHVGSRHTGLVAGLELIRLVNYDKESEDYHKCMNWDMFRTWMCDTVLPHLQQHHPNAVLVLDQASYHRVLTADTNNSWKKLRKAELIEFLLARGVPDYALPPHTPMTVLDLHELGKTVVGPPEYEIARLAAERGITVVFLPVAHPELNPIETICAFSKNAVRANNGLDADKPFSSAPTQKTRWHAGGLCADGDRELEARWQRTSASWRKRITSCWRTATTLWPRTTRRKCLRMTASSCEIFIFVFVTYYFYPLRSCVHLHYLFLLFYVSSFISMLVGPLPVCIEHFLID